MKDKQAPSPSQPGSTPAVSRRTLFAGAGTAGALAAAATLLPLGKADAPAVVAKAAERSDGGYQLTEHVQRYYQTARV